MSLLGIQTGLGPGHNSLDTTAISDQRFLHIVKEEDYRTPISRNRMARAHPLRLADFQDLQHVPQSTDV